MSRAAYDDARFARHMAEQRSRGIALAVYGAVLLLWFVVLPAVSK